MSNDSQLETFLFFPQIIHLSQKVGLGYVRILVAKACDILFCSYAGKSLMFVY